MGAPKFYDTGTYTPESTVYSSKDGHFCHNKNTLKSRHQLLVPMQKIVWRARSFYRLRRGKGSGKTPLPGFVLIARASDKINEINGAHPQMLALNSNMFSHPRNWKSMQLISLGV